jgi:hypothetical protein
MTCWRSCGRSESRTVGRRAEGRNRAGDLLRFSGFRKVVNTFTIIEVSSFRKMVISWVSVPNVGARRAVADRLDRVDLPYAFVGGSVVNLLIDHPELTPARPTDDVDVVIHHGRCEVLGCGSSAACGRLQPFGSRRVTLHYSPRPIPKIILNSYITFVANRMYPSGKYGSCFARAYFVHFNK